MKIPMKKLTGLTGFLFLAGMVSCGGNSAGQGSVTNDPETLSPGPIASPTSPLSVTLDSDGDGVADAADNCDLVANPEQENQDADGAGDACDVEPEVADVPLDAEIPPTDPPGSIVPDTDTDGDGILDAVDPDDDNDGVAALVDSLPRDSSRFAIYRLNELSPLVGGDFAITSDIADNGTIVGASNSSPSFQSLDAVTWTVGPGGDLVNGPTLLHPQGGSGSAFGVNNGGRVVGRFEIAPGRFSAVLFNGENNAPTELLSLSPPDGQSVAYSINDQGMVVGQSDDASVNRKAVLWILDAGGTVTAGPVELGTLGGASSAAYYVANDGSIVGEAMDVLGRNRAVLWKVDLAGNILIGPVDLGTLPSDTTAVALGINASGVVVGTSGGSVSGVTRAVSWAVNASGNATGVPVILGSVTLPAGQDAIAYAINDSGRIAGSADGAGLQGRAVSVVWDASLVQKIHETVFDTAISEVRSINTSGQLSGSFRTETGQLRPFVATPVVLP